MENLRAIRSYEKCGFQREGVQRQAFWTVDGYRDKVLMAILRTDWEQMNRVDKGRRERENKS